MHHLIEGHFRILGGTRDRHCEPLLRERIMTIAAIRDFLVDIYMYVVQQCSVAE